MTAGRSGTGGGGRQKKLLLGNLHNIPNGLKCCKITSVAAVPRRLKRRVGWRQELRINNHDKPLARGPERTGESRATNTKNGTLFHHIHGPDPEAEREGGGKGSQKEEAALASKASQDMLGDIHMLLNHHS
ncbi:hypothetical protein F4824DRAFT_497625 [Ustulina deusta]|nr:hypothetical protein F4824DRAFT_497625 [Ustulina deusta]